MSVPYLSAIMSGLQAFVQQQSSIYAPRQGFSHVVGQHANQLVQLVQADRQKEGKRRTLLDIWKVLGSVNDSWVQLLCKYHKDGQAQEFRGICSQLVNGYTESVGDYVLEGACHAQRVGKLTETEAKFYSALQNNDISTMRRQWLQYQRLSFFCVF
jgi:hypothetical protein